MQYPKGAIILSNDGDLCSIFSWGAHTFGIKDGGAIQAEICQSNDLMFNPYESLAQLYTHSMKGQWILVTEEGRLNVPRLQINYCYTPSSGGCTHDVMRALTNESGFRYDPSAQMASFTEDIFDESGRFKQVTISRLIIRLD